MNKIQQINFQFSANSTTLSVVVKKEFFNFFFLKKIRKIKIKIKREGNKTFEILLLIQLDSLFRKKLPTTSLKEKKTTYQYFF